jgi:hypothetical protein
MNEGANRGNTHEKNPRSNDASSENRDTLGAEASSRRPEPFQAGTEGHISEARSLAHKAETAQDAAVRRRLVDAALEQLQVAQEGIDEEKTRLAGIRDESKAIAQAMEAYEQSVAENADPEDEPFFQIPENAQILEDQKLVEDEQGKLERKIEEESRELDEVRRELTAQEDVEAGDPQSERSPGYDEKNGQKSIEVVELKRSPDEGGENVVTVGGGPAESMDDVPDIVDEAEGDAQEDPGEVEQREGVERESIVMNFDSQLSADESFRKCAADGNVRRKLGGYGSPEEVMQACREKYLQESETDPILNSEFFKSSSWTVHIAPDGTIERFVPNPTKKDLLKMLFGEVLVRTGSERWSAVENLTEEEPDGQLIQDRVGVSNVFAYLRSLEDAYGIKDAGKRNIARRVLDLSQRSKS